MRLLQAAALVALLLALLVDAKKKKKTASPITASPSVAVTVVPGTSTLAPTTLAPTTLAPTTLAPASTSTPTSLAPSSAVTGSPSTPSNACQTSTLIQNCTAQHPLPNVTFANYTAACTALKTEQAAVWACFYTMPGYGNCTSSICLDNYCSELTQLNTLLAAAASKASGGKNGTCVWSVCSDFCSAQVVNTPTRAPSPANSTPAPVAANSTCQEIAVSEYCDARVPSIQNSSDYTTACNNAKRYTQNLVWCADSTTQFGNCSQAACLEAWCNNASMSIVNGEITLLANAVSGTSGSCTFQSCQEACTPLAPSQASALCASSVVLAAVLMAAGWTSVVE